MKYRLGLDVGTASVGLVALELDGKGRATKPIHHCHSVRIFEEPLLPGKKGGVGETKKSARRRARQQRRQHLRRARMLRHIAQLAPLMDLDPEKIPADKGQRIHQLRAQAANSAIRLEDLLLVFLKMAKRRGYRGEFKERKSGKGMVETGIGELENAIEKAGRKTLGEYLWHRIQNKQHLRLKEDGLFVRRKMVEDEFNLIWNTQQEKHPVLNKRGLREKFHRVIVKQRPLKSPVAGNCSLGTMLPRAPKAQMAMQEFRIEEQIANLRWGTSSRAGPLLPEQKEIIRALLHTQAEVKFSTIYKKLEKSGCPDPQGRELNLSRGGRQTLIGNRTVAKMKWLKLLDQWNALADGHQISVINLLADMGSPGDFTVPDWDKNLMKAKPKKGDREEDKLRKIQPEVKDFINQMVETGKFNHLSAMKFDSGRASYSIKALKKLVSLMREDGMNSHDAIAKAYPDKQKPSSDNPLKELPPHKPTGNTVIDVALRQVRREVNAAIAKVGAPPSQIIVELSRDMRVGLKMRDEINAKMRANEKRRREAADKIEEYSHKPATGSQILRYLLWQEQGERYCPYCDAPIKLGDALDGGKVDREHILPQSLTRIRKNRKFLVLAHKSCNADKRDRTPWQAWGDDEERWGIIERRAEQFKDGFGDKKKYGRSGSSKAWQLLVKDFKKDVLDKKAIDEFSRRQFQETAWIAKVCGKWLRLVCADVSFSYGRLTAHLRRTWGLDTVIPEVRYKESMPVFDMDYQPSEKESSQQQQRCVVSSEDFDKYRLHWEGHDGEDISRTHRRLNKRIDHRHHLVDALVIALTTRGMYQRMAKHYKQVTESGKDGLRLYAEPEIKKDILRAEALELVCKCQPSHRPDHWLGGNLFKARPATVVEENGKKFYARRKALADLPETSIDKILPESIRKIVSDEYHSRKKRGDSHEDALKDIKHPHWNTPIRRVLVRGDNATDAKLIKHGKRTTGLHKYLEPEGYAYMEFNPRNPGALPQLFRLHEAIGRGSPQPGIVRLYKADTVLDSEDNVLNSEDKKYYVVKHFTAEGPTLFVSPITEAIADIGNARGKRKKKISGKEIAKRLSLKDECP